jgi:methyltransferase (TIGR00027 family)
MTAIPPEPAPSLQQTADWLAAIRAEELSQPDPFQHDPYAALLATKQAHEAADALRQLDAPLSCAIIRGRLGDEALRHALAEGIRQVVSLGAGAETRAFRQDLPADLDYFEVDLPGTVTAKEQILRAAGIQPACRRIAVETDIRSDWSIHLAAAGLRTDRPTLWTVEGLLPYLYPPDRDALMYRINAVSRPGSALTGDTVLPVFLQHPDHQRFLTYMYAKGIRPIATDDPAGWLQTHGWAAHAYLLSDLIAGEHPLLDDPIPPRLRTAYPGFCYLHATLR